MKTKVNTLKTYNLKSRYAIFFLGCVVGAVFFLLIYTASPLDVSDDSWIRDGYIEQDIIQHYTGWLFYRDTPIGLPLGFTDLINYPLGSSVSFTDSIPIFAIIFRFLSPVLGETFQYFGIYTLLCFMLQGGASALLISLFDKRYITLFAGTSLFVLSPILLEKAFRHVALTSHFLIIFALFLYFENKKSGFLYRKRYIALLCLATAIHPYFLPMLFAILFADLVEHCIDKKTVLKPLGFLVLSIACVLVTALTIGLFSTPSSNNNLAGFGYFQMNLNSLFNPLSQGDIVWSSLIPTQNQGLGSYEGFNYLGLGMLLALPLCAAIFLFRHKLNGTLSELKKHIGLVFVLACLTLFALSSTLIANNTILFSITLPEPIKSMCDTFRASGRMFWPVYYIGFLFAVVTISKLKLKKLSAISLLLLLCVQVADMAPALVSKHGSIEKVDFETPLQSYVWEQIADEFENMFFLEPLPAEGVFCALFAADSDMTTNHAWSARFDLEQATALIDAERARLLSGEFDDRTVYLTNSLTALIEVAHLNEDIFWAVRLDELYYVLIPKASEIPEPQNDENTHLYDELPFRISDYSDSNWTNGVLNSNKKIVAFSDNPFTASRLDDAEYFIVDNIEYEILLKDYGDPGWVMVTLDIEDATVLVEKDIITR